MNNTFSILPLRIDSSRADLGSFVPDAKSPLESTGGTGIDIGGGGGGGGHTADVGSGGGGGAGAPEKHTSHSNNFKNITSLSRKKMNSSEFSVYSGGNKKALHCITLDYNV